jgi:FKBP-type peptidyl-prolyl cis-trans isomerase (trigger factor)
MKSTVTKLADFKDYLKDFKVDFQLDEIKLNDEFKAILIKNKIVETVGKIENGDIVTVNLKSDYNKFQKENLRIVVGSQYFSKNLEESLVGLHLGAEKLLKVDGHEVNVKIIDIKRNKLPELSDELIKKENIDGVNTISDYKKMFYQKTKESYIMDEVIKLSINIFHYLQENSEFIIYDEDVEESLEEMMNYYRGAAKTAGFELETMTSEQLMEISNAKSYEALITSEKNISTSLVKISAICAKVLNKDIKELEVNRNNVLKLQIEFTDYLKSLLKI